MTSNSKCYFLKKCIALFILFFSLTLLSYSARIYLVSGRMIIGKIIEYDDEKVIILHKGLGRITIPRSKIVRIEPPDEESWVKEKLETSETHEKEHRALENTISKIQNRISIGLTGAYSYIDVGNINTVLDSHSSYWQSIEEVSRYEGESVERTGKSGIMRWMPEVYGELDYFILPNLSVGLSVGYMHRSIENSMEISNTDSLYKQRYEISVVPILLSCSVYRWLYGSLWYFNLGAGYYLGDFKFEIDDGPLLSESGNANQLALGVQGASGTEILLTRHLSLKFEASVRYLKFNNWRADDDSMNSTDRNGQIYTSYVDDLDFQKRVYYFTVSKPLSAINDLYRSAEIDLSGLALKAGIKVRF